MSKNYIDFNEKPEIIKPVLYVALFKVNLETQEKTEIRRVYRKSQLDGMIEERIQLNRDHIDDKEYYVTMTLMDEKLSHKKV